MIKKEKITVMLPSMVVAELRYLIKLCHVDPLSIAPGTVEDLIAHVMLAVADGSRRPGAWERTVISMLGLVSREPEHQSYRSTYGDPAKAARFNDG